MRTGSIIAIGAVVAVIGVAIGLSEYNRAPAGAASAVPVHVISAEHLLLQFQQDESAATGIFVGQTEQVIQVNGTIREISAGDGDLRNVILGTGDPLAGVVCEFKAADLPAEWKAGDEVEVKGFCKGMLMDVLLQRCVAADRNKNKNR